MEEFLEALRNYIDKHFEYEFRSRHGDSYLGYLGGEAKGREEMEQAWEKVKSAAKALRRQVTTSKGE